FSPTVSPTSTSLPCKTRPMWPRSSGWCLKRRREASSPRSACCRCRKPRGRKNRALPMAAFTAISRRAVFLDKDGTLLHDLPYNVDPARVSVREGAFAALRRIQGAGYRLFVVSNQPGIALGTFTRSELRTLETYLVDAFRKEGVCLDGF